MPNRCAAGSNCVVPAEEHWLLDWSPPELASLTIRRKLEWDRGILVLSCVGFLGFRKERSGRTGGGRSSFVGTGSRGIGGEKQRGRRGDGD